MRLIPLGEERPIDRATFADTAQAEWRTAKDAWLAANRHMDQIAGLLFKAGQVKVSGQVTGALYTAKQLRDDVDRVIDALDEIVRAGRKTS